MKSEFYEKIITYLYYILFFILPFIVLPVNSELFEFNKMLFIYAIASLIGGVWVLRSFQENKFSLQKTPLDIPLALFFMSQIISTLLSIDRHTSLFGYYGRFNGGLISTFTYLFLYYALVTNIRISLPNTIKKIFFLSAASSILVVLWGLPGKFNRDLSCLLFTSKFNNSCWTAQFKPAERMFSTLGQPNWLGAYLAITFFIGLYIVISAESKKKYFLGSMGVFFSYMGILLSRSRSSLVSIVPGLFFLGIYFSILFFKKKNFISPLKKKVGGLIITGLVLITIIAQTGIPQVDSLLTFSFFNHNPNPQSTQLNPPAPPSSLEVVGPITESLDIRKIVWQGAWELGSQYPLFGTGVETFGYAYYSVRPLAHNLTSEWDYLYNKAHNEFLNILATTGWFGLGAYLILILWVIIRLVKIIIRNTAHPEKIFLYLTFFGILISIGITNFFGFSITVIQLYWYILFAFISMEGMQPVGPTSLHKKVSLSQVGIVVVCMGWLLNSIGTYWLADYTYAQSDVAMKNNNPAASANLLQRSLMLREEHVYEDKLSYALAQYAYLLSAQKDKSSVPQIIDMAEKLNLKSITASTQNVLYWKTRVKNQYIFYQMSLDKKYLFTGISALNEATKLAPTDPKIPYFSATYYSLLYDDEKNKDQRLLYKKKSLDAINQTITLKSDYGEAYYLKVQLLRKYGEKVAARELLQWYIPRYAPDNTEIKKELSEL